MARIINSICTIMTIQGVIVMKHAKQVCALLLGSFFYLSTAYAVPIKIWPNCPAPNIGTKWQYGQAIKFYNSSEMSVLQNYGVTRGWRLWMQEGDSVTIKTPMYWKLSEDVFPNKIDINTKGPQQLGCSINYDNRNMSLSTTVNLDKLKNCKYEVENIDFYGSSFPEQVIVCQT